MRSKGNRVSRSPEEVEFSPDSQAGETFDSVASRAKSGIQQMTEQVNLPPDLKRQADVVADQAMAEILAVENIETTFDTVEQADRLQGDEVEDLASNITKLLKGELAKQAGSSTEKDFRKNFNSWEAQVNLVLNSDKVPQKKIVLLRHIFKTTFPELADLPQSRVGKAQAKGSENQFMEDLGSQEKEPDFSQAKNFEELYKMIDEYGPVKGGLGLYDPEILKSLIVSATEDVKNLDYITVVGGLREKVEELIKADKISRNAKEKIVEEEEDKKIVDEKGKLKILSVEQLSKLSDKALSKVRDTFLAIPKTDDPDTELYFNRVWDEIERRHPETREKIDILSAEELTALNDKDWDKLYYDLVGGKDALLLIKKKTPEESQYFTRLIFEQGRRRQLETGVVAKENKQEDKKISPDFSQAKSLAEIYDLIDKTGEIKIERNNFSPSVLKHMIEAMANGEMESVYLFESFGLKEAVDRILPEERARREALKSVDNLADLSSKISSIGEIKEKGQIYTPEVLKTMIEKVLSGESPLESIPLAGGLREKAANLLTDKKQNDRPIQNIANLRNLINQLNMASYSNDREDKQESLLLASQMLNEPALAKSMTRKELAAAIEQAAIKAEQQIHKLEGVGSLEKPEEKTIKISEAGKEVTYNLSHYQDTGFVINKVSTNNEMPVPTENFLVDNWKDFTANSDLRFSGGQVARKNLLQADIFSLFHKQNILYHLAPDEKSLKEELGRDIEKDIFKIEKKYGAVLKPEVKKNLREFLNPVKKTEAKESPKNPQVEQEIQESVSKVTASEKHNLGKQEVGVLFYDDGKVKINKNNLTRELNGLAKKKVLRPKWLSLVKNPKDRSETSPVFEIEQIAEDIYLQNSLLKKYPPSSEKWSALHKNIEQAIIEAQSKHGEIFNAKFLKEFNKDNTKKASWREKFFGIFKGKQKKSKYEVEPDNDTVENITVAEQTPEQQVDKILTVNGIKYYINFGPDDSIVIEKTEGISKEMYEKVLPPNWEQLLRYNPIVDKEKILESVSDCDRYAYTVFVLKNLQDSTDFSTEQKNIIQRNIDYLNQDWHSKYDKIFGLTPQVDVLAESKNPDKVASVPFMITRDTRQRLYDLGKSQEEVDRMTPIQAQEVLTAQIANQENQDFVVPEFLRAKKEPIPKETDQSSQINTDKVFRSKRIEDLKIDQDDRPEEEVMVPEFLRAKTPNKLFRTDKKSIKSNGIVDREFEVPEFLRQQSTNEQASSQVATENLEIEARAENIPVTEMTSDEGLLGGVKPYNPPENTGEQKFNGKTKLSKKEPKVIEGELGRENWGVVGEAKFYNPESVVPVEKDLLSGTAEDFNSTEEKILSNIPVSVNQEAEIKKSKIELPNKQYSLSTHTNGVDCDLTFYDDNHVELLKRSISKRSSYEADPLREVLRSDWQKILKKDLKLSGDSLAQAIKDIEHAADDIYFKTRIHRHLDDTMFAKHRSALAVDITNTELRLLHQYANIFRDGFFDGGETIQVKTKRAIRKIKNSL